MLSSIVPSSRENNDKDCQKEERYLRDHAGAYEYVGRDAGEYDRQIHAKAKVSERRKVTTTATF